MRKTFISVSSDLGRSVCVNWSILGCEVLGLVDLLMSEPSLLPLTNYINTWVQHGSCRDHTLLRQNSCQFQPVILSHCSWGESP